MSATDQPRPPQNGKPEKPEVTVTFNGGDAVLPYQPNASAESLLAHAKQHFGVQSQHLLSLFTADGVEIPDGTSLAAAGIVADALLVLRQSTVRGGAGRALRLADGVLPATVRTLRDCGAGRRECVAYWTAERQRPDVVTGVVHPRHAAGLDGYEVDSGWVTEFFMGLRESGRTVVAQVHTHPEEASHSDVDDAFALAPATGFFSVVIPDFACAEDGLARAHVVVMRPDGSWQEVDHAAAIAC